MRDDPLVLFASPRGGSSLVAGAFVNHGFWTGRTFGQDRPGYENHENAEIKAFLKKHWKLDAGNHALDATRADLRRHCEQVVPTDGLWLFKGASEYYAVWRAYFPLMRAVMVFRDRSQAVEAHVRRRGENVREIASQVVTRRYAYMDAVLKHEPYSWRVDADKLVNGDSSQLAPVLAEYGIDLDHRLAMENVSPELFHQ